MDNFLEEHQLHKHRYRTRLIALVFNVPPTIYFGIYAFTNPDPF